MKKLYRYPEKGYIGGVCHGLGEHTNIDPVIWRIVTVFWRTWVRLFSTLDCFKKRRSMKILITGASSGIGHEISKELINEKHELVLHYNKNKKKLQPLLTKNTHTVSQDLSSSLGAQQLYEENNSSLWISRRFN